jgi:hypothetical protein
MAWCSARTLGTIASRTASSVVVRRENSIFVGCGTARPCTARRPFPQGEAIWPGALLVSAYTVDLTTERRGDGEEAARPANSQAQRPLAGKQAG